jgi:hypothetical protein
MKNTKWVGLVTALAFPLLCGYGQTPEAPAPGTPESAPAAVPANLSPGAAEVVRLAGAGVGDDVVLAYIQNSQAPFNLAADDVLYLKDIGLSPQVTSAMLTHDTTLRNQTQQYAPAATAPAAPPETAATAPAPAEPSAPVTTPSPVYVSSAPADVGYFYNDLAPYGTWVSLEGYGWCWQPRVVVISRDWRPYCDGGHWVYTDAGWYWQSDYSWGWAPFHYGRWHQHPRSGWVWLPDRVWGPAWVTWRTAGDHCGWAPLPPRAEFDVRLGWRFNGVSVGANFDFGLGVNAFAFVALGDFCNRDLGHRRLPPERVAPIYHRATIVNNYVVNNNAIVHRGIPIERVTAASRVPVPRATVRDWHAAPGSMPSRTASVVYRPELRPPVRPVNMAAQRLDERHPVIQHAPIAPVRMDHLSPFSHRGAAPVAIPPRPALEAPKVSPWTSGPKPAPALRPQPVPGSVQPAPKAPPAKPPPTSTWPGGARPTPSPQVAPTPSTPRPAPAAPPAKPPQTSTRPGGAKPTPSPQVAPAPSTPRSAPTVAPAPAAPRAPDDWKQGTRAAPGYRGDTGSPANTSRAAAPSAPVAAPTPAPARSTPARRPKPDHQAAEVRSLPPPNRPRPASSSSPGKSTDSKSGKKQ